MSRRHLLLCAVTILLAMFAADSANAWRRHYYRPYHVYRAPVVVRVARPAYYRPYYYPPPVYSHYYYRPPVAGGYFYGSWPGVSVSVGW